MNTSSTGTKEFLKRHRRQNPTGSVLAGKYRLIAELGQGGMAMVYLAVAVGNQGFRRLAVLKVLQPQIAEDADFVQMFLDEAKLCARLAHPNIVHTYDVGGDELGHLIAMEYLDGVSMYAAVGKIGRDKGPFKFPLQARVLLEVLEGLRYAHELCDYDGRPLHIVHRDVTPHNIFITYEGQVKLLDFGIAKASTSSVKTATGVVKGKLTYMAPEQARGERVDARADLYAVGVMLWEAVTGRRRLPSGLTEPALFVRLIAGEPPESPDAAAHGYPAEIDAIVLKALAPNPDDRFQTAAEFRDALERVLQLLPPTPLRDLGGMLAEAFADNRRRIREVIEEQFRMLDRGDAAPTPTEIPSVRPATHGIGSDSHDFRFSRARGEGRMDSGQVTVTATNVSITARYRRRTRIAFVLAAVLSLFVLALFAVMRSRTETPATASANAPPKPVQSAAPGPASGSTGATTAETAPSPSESAGAPGEGPAPADFARHANPRKAGAHAAPTSHDGQGNATTSDAPRGDEPRIGVVLRKPDGKPKVQLERDNPWP